MECTLVKLSAVNGLILESDKARFLDGKQQKITKANFSKYDDDDDDDDDGATLWGNSQT